MKRLNGYNVFLFQEFAASLLFAVIFTANLLYQVQVVGLNPFQLVLVGTLLEATVFLAEVPTGIIADVYSRRLSILIGFVLVGIGFFIEGSIPQFWAVLLAQVVWGIGATCMSGAVEAWVADEVGQEKAGAAFLRGKQFGDSGELLGVILSVALGSVALNIPILVGAALFLLLAVLLAFIMPERGFTPKLRENRNPFQQMQQTLSESTNLVRSRRVFLTLLVAAASFGAFSEGFDRLWIPHLLEFSVPYFAPIVWIGIVSVTSLVLEILATEFVRRRVDTNSQVVVARALQLIVFFVMTLTLVYGLAWDFAIALVAVLALKPIRHMNYPLATAWLNQHADPSVRATVFSIHSQADALGQIIGGPILGAIATLVSLRAKMVIAALFLLPAVYMYSGKIEIIPPVAPPVHTEA